MLKFNLLIILNLLIFQFSFLFSQDDERREEKQPIYFEVAIEKYISGDLSGAIDVLETAIDMEKTSKNYPKIKSFLVMVLSDAGTRAYLVGDYRKANQYFSRALKIAPEDYIIRQLSIWTQEANKLKAKKDDKEDIPKRIDDNFLIFHTEQERLIKDYAGKDKKNLDLLLTKLDSQRKILSVEIEAKTKGAINNVVNNVEGKFTGTVFRYSATLTVILAFLICISFFVLHRLNLRHQREMIIKLGEYHRNILERLQVPVSEVKKIPQERIFREEISKLPPEDRLKGVEIIETELVSEREIAERLLENFIKDNNVKVRVRAAEALYRYNAKRAMNLLEEMSQETPELKLEVIKILERIESPHSVRILLDLLEENDVNVKTAVVSCIKQIIETKKSWVPNAIKSELAEIIRKHRRTE